MPYNYGRAGRQANTEAGTTAASAPSYGPAGSDRGLVTVTSPAGAKYQVSPVIASRVAGFLGELHDMGYDTLGQDENFGYAPRDVRDSPGTPSQHSFGNAIDINSRENHRLTHPELERTGITDSNLPANVDSIAAKYGLSWGGNYVTAKTDPMHFEGETFSSAQKAASPSVPMGIYGHKSADAIDHFRDRKAAIEGVNPAQTAIDRSTAPPQTAGDRMRSILGLPATLSVEAANAIAQGVVSLGQLAAEVANESAAQQPSNPRAAAPPSSFPSRPAGPISSNQTSAPAPSGTISRSSLPNPNAGVIGAAPASDMRDSPAARMHAGLAASGVQASYDPASGRVGFSPIGALGPQGAADAAHAGGRNSTPAGTRGFPQGAPTNIGPVAAADRAGNAVAQGGLGGLIGSLGRAAMATPSSAPARAAPSYGGPMAAADRSNNAWGNTAPKQATAMLGPTVAADRSNKPQPLASLGLPAGLKTDYAGLGVPSLAIGPAPTVADMETNTLSQQIADALGTGYAPGAVLNKKPGEVGYKAPAAAPLAPKPAADRPAAPAPAARPLAHPQSPFAPGTDAFDEAGQLVGTVNGYGKFQAPSFAAGTAVTDQAGNVVGHYDNTGKMQRAEPLGFFGSIAAALGLNADPSSGASRGGQNNTGSPSRPSAGQIGGISGRNGTTSGLGGGRAGNDSGQQHG